MNQYEKIVKCVEKIRESIEFIPKVAIVLGSGLGELANEMDVVGEISYHDIPGFPVSTVAGHDGRFIFGYLKEVPVVCMKGRVHYYEGYDMKDVVLPIRVMKLLGAKILFLTNASGGVNETFAAGNFMLIKDHISCFVPNPLMGENMEQLGTRFPDMTEIYTVRLQNIIKETAKECNISLQEGVYAQFSGPSYESAAEIKMLQKLGVDAVGMSTVVEAMVAKHMGMEICGISCVSNLATGLSKTVLSHEEVQEAANKSAPAFRKLVIETIGKLGC